VTNPVAGAATEGKRPYSGQHSCQQSEPSP
jgi:hypothetical protein